MSPFAEKLASVSYWIVSSKLENSLVLYELTRSAYPDSYLRRLHLRLPWFIYLAEGGGFARLEVSTRLVKQSVRYGPFRTRDDAALYEEQVLALHQLRRCTDLLTPSPDHPGCIYGEMNQCLRPCQCAVSPDEYAHEAARVTDFLNTAGKHALHSLAAARDHAAANLDFEQAALAHKRMEKVQATNALRDPIIAPAQDFNGIAATRSREADSVKLWIMRAGYWQNPMHLYLPLNQEAGARSLDTMLREQLQNVLATPPEQTGNRSEHIALFSRWYYSSWRDGQWFPFNANQHINYRRLVRSVSELLKPNVAKT